MANRVYIIPRRNDLESMNIQITDLSPNTSQRNSIYDGEGQTHYIGACPDAPGVTVVSGNAFISGSRSTSLTANAAIADTTGGGNDCYATGSATFGLAAYLRERIAKDPGGANVALTFANANTIAAAIRGAAAAGTALTATAINVLLAATGGAGTALDGGDSFGSVEEILRILSGEVYRSPVNTIVTDAVPNFLGLAGRDALVAAQLSSTTGKTFVSQGGFLTSLENGFVGRPVIAKTGYLLGSAGAGQLHHFKSARAILNPAFSYGSAGTALSMDGSTHIAATGSYAVLAVYDHTGTVI